MSRRKVNYKCNECKRELDPEIDPIVKVDGTGVCRKCWGSEVEPYKKPKVRKIHDIL